MVTPPLSQTSIAATADGENESFSSEGASAPQAPAKPARLEGVTEIPDASAYVAHLASYPALAALNGLISSFPVPKIFASNGVPLLMYLRDNNAENNRAVV